MKARALKIDDDIQMEIYALCQLAGELAKNMSKWMHVEALNDGVYLPIFIGRSMPIASLRPTACFQPLFADSPIDRFLPC